MEKEIGTWINAHDDGRIFIDEFDDDVWVLLRTSSARMHVIISPEAAQEMIEALQKVLQKNVQ